MRAVRGKIAAAIAVAALLAGATAGCGGSGSRSGPGSRPGSDGGSGSTATARPVPSSPHRRLRVKASPHHLPAPVSGEAVVPQGKDLLIIGGLDESDTSVAGVTRLEPARGTTTPAGELPEPLHDIAATATPAGVLVFGGGAATTTAVVQRLVPDGGGEPVGELPIPRSDLSAVTIGGAAYVLGGYDGERAVGDVLRTRDGTSLETVGRLRTPVRYTAVVAVGPNIYAFGGEETSGADTAVIQRFDTTTGRTSIVGHLPGTLAHASAVALGGRIFILGGRVDGRTSARIVRFEPATGRTIKVGRLPAPVQNAAAAVAGGAAYLIGGLSAAEMSLSSIVRLDLGAPAGG